MPTKEIKVFLNEDKSVDVTMVNGEGLSFLDILLMTRGMLKFVAKRVGMKVSTLYRLIEEIYQEDE